MRGSLARLGRALAEEWYGAVPSEHDVIEVELISCRGREVAREQYDRGMLTALRLVLARQERTLAVDGRDLDTLASVIETLAARCPEEDHEGSTA